LANAVLDGGWRKVEADGVNFLEPDVFAVQNRFSVAPGKEVAFEQRWANRESKLHEFPGFVTFMIQRRDATRADDGFNYISTTFWSSKEAFLNWKEAQKTVVHGGGASSSGGVSAGPVKGDLLGPPKVAYYEGKLALMSKEGA
jgi:heme-degrading monooxygenase HmoA